MAPVQSFFMLHLLQPPCPVVRFSRLYYTSCLLCLDFVAELCAGAGWNTFLNLTTTNIELRLVSALF